MRFTKLRLCRFSYGKEEKHQKNALSTVKYFSLKKKQNIKWTGNHELYID